MPEKPAQPPRVAVYARQSVRQDQGIAQQRAELLKEAEHKGWTVVGQYVDNDTSATKDRGDDTEWGKMLAAIDAGGVDIVLAVSASRLLRRTVDAVELSMPRRNVRVVTVRDGIDTASGGGRILLAVMIAMAEEEIREKEARAVPYRAARRAAGHPAPGLPPYGYRWLPQSERDAAETRYAIIEHEAAALRYAASAALSGDSCATIARALSDGTATDENGKPLDPRTRCTRKGAAWGVSTVRRMLVNPLSAAMLPPAMPEGERYKIDIYAWSQCTPGAWPGILEPDTVQVLRAKLLDPARRTNQAGTAPKWLLTHVGRCGACGGRLRHCITRPRKGGTPVDGYRCKRGCFQRPAELIEEFVRSKAVERLSEPGLLERLPESTVDVGALHTRQDALAASRREAKELYEDETYTAAEFSERVARIREELAEIDAQLASAAESDPVSRIVGADDIGAAWAAMSTDRRRAVLRALYKRIELFPVGKGRRVTTLDAVAATVRCVPYEKHRASLMTGETYHMPTISEEGQAAIVAAIDEI